ncbi:MAG: TolC family protein [Planctomycetota bacterium]
MRTWTMRVPDAPGVRAYAATLARLAPTQPGPYDPTDGLTLAEAEVVALFFNPGLRMARLEARVPALAARQAGRPPDPRLQLDVLRIVESVASPWILASGLQLTVPVAGRLGAERAHALAEADVARREAYAAEVETIATLREAWNTWSAVGERVALVSAHLEGLGGVLGLARAQREGNQIGEPELRVLEIERVRSQGRLEALQREGQRHELALKRLMGLAPEAAVALVPSFTADAEPLDVATERERLREASPALALAHARHVESERSLRLAMLERQDDASLAPLVESEDGEARLGGTLDIPLVVGDGNRQAIAEALARRDAARGTLEARQDDLMGELADRHAAWEAAKARDAWVREHVAPLADQQLAELQTLGELGDLDVLILKDALTSLLEAKEELLDARLERAQASARIHTLVTPLRTPYMEASPR